ncbi:DJ-1/PfpI family protein (macronuclear) [Tetrahymena thermophila SB210]|uniref:DJ-1/PfpI family protein n=1 Tax=Tetrahymena thermophila (strain SB210) TaxID=312017 RepID=I7M4Q1_TETTS|nr:DJ-1/PfpI family protein [Tetrahymena thermophila SB210]EAS07827.1 DJ-1/PfpI family protein [Tetrahymena thermophila SB210]|eukprot:XP_001028069.1 DJ-1/PfpI family protein [Tetrahymena thermophila SB210]
MDNQKKILVPIAPCFEEIEAITVIDLFRRIGADIIVASILNKSEGLVVKGANGIQIICDKNLEEVIDQDFDMIVCPGGMPGAQYLSDCQILIQRLKKQKEQDKYYAAICAAPFVIFEKHGFLNSQVAGTCHPGFADKLANQTKVNLDVVVSGKCVTSKSAGTAMDFGLQLLRLLYPEQQVLDVLKKLVYTK